jgi:hypothetical protein
MHQLTRTLQLIEESLLRQAVAGFPDLELLESASLQLGHQLTLEMRSPGEKIQGLPEAAAGSPAAIPRTPHPRYRRKPDRQPTSDSVPDPSPLACIIHDSASRMP